MTVPLMDQVYSVRNDVALLFARLRDEDKPPEVMKQAQMAIVAFDLLIKRLKENQQCA